MGIQLRLGLETILSYKRLSYTAWHALAEFIDNSTESYRVHSTELDAAFAKEDRGLEISVVYERGEHPFIRVVDNAMGMSEEDLTASLHIGERPADTTGRSKFGMGLKTAACWLGNRWSVRTKKLGETIERVVEIDVDTVADGTNDLPYRVTPDRDPSEHYTIIEIHDLNRQFQGRTLGKIKQFMRSMYRQDLRAHRVTLEWQGDPLEWDDSDAQFLKAKDGSAYRKDFRFQVDGEDVHGWVGVLDKGSRSKAGFSILHADRVVKGWPDSWRPEEIFGQFQGSNDLVNQRVIGEIHLDGFDVSHTKDDILWLGRQEDDVQKELKKICADYVAVAKTRRKGDEDERGPSDLEIQTAVEELQQELSSAELADMLNVETVPPPNVVTEVLKPLLGVVAGREPSYQANLGGFAVRGYLVDELSPNNRYVVVDATSTARVVVVVNLHHPHIEQISGAEGFLNYLRHCTYDAIAEWQARHKASNIEPDTIKVLKDRLLRLSFEIEMHGVEGFDPEAAETPASLGGLGRPPLPTANYQPATSAHLIHPHQWRTLALALLSGEC